MGRVCWNRKWGGSGASFNGSAANNGEVFVGVANTTSAVTLGRNGTATTVAGRLLVLGQATLSALSVSDTLTALSVSVTGLLSGSHATLSGTLTVADRVSVVRCSPPGL